MVNLPTLVSTFLSEQLGTSNPSVIVPDVVPVKSLSVYHSAIATFYAPSDPSGIGGMRREWIRSTPSWRKGPARRDCCFIEQNSNLKGFRGLFAARSRLFFSFKYLNVSYPCVLAEWFSAVQNTPDELTGMWIVEPDLDRDGQPMRTVVHIDTVFRGAHLIPVYGPNPIPSNMSASQSLDTFRAYYVNKFADHHSHEIAF